MFYFHPQLRLFVVVTVTLIIPLPSARASTSSANNNNCPQACFCNLLSKIVYCSRRGLTVIPTGISADSLQLNLNGNLFQSTTLQRSNFTGYDSLEHLYLSECGIERIELGTFVHLANLKWLDLSNNRLRILGEYGLSGLNLQHLFLNGNRHIRLLPESFEGLVTTGLYLHDCSLSWLQPEVLGPLNSTLKYLWLNGNELDRIDPQFLGLFATMQHLRLASNPLHCNCEVLWLKEFFDKNGDVFKGAVAPSCLTPQRLRGKFFNQLSLFDFRCQAPMFNNIETTFGSNGRLKCTASGDPAPVLYWIQPSGKTTKYTPPADEEARKNEGILTIQNDDGNLFGMYICVANNEAGNVTLTINVSWPLTRSVVGAPLDVLATVIPSIPSSNRMELFHHAAESGITTTISAAVASSIFSQTLELHQRVDELSLGGKDGKDDDGRASGGDPAVRSRAGTNYTVIDGVDVNVSHHPKLFTVTELVCAVIGTHLGTLALCLIVFPILYRTKWRTSGRKNRHPQPPLLHPTNARSYNHHQFEYNPAPLPPQPPPPRQMASVETAYLTGNGHNNRYLADYLIASGTLR